MSISDKLTTIAENQERVFEAGKKSQYDEFWDNYQNYGGRTNYNEAFASDGWNTKTFKPKYDLKNVIQADRMFYQFNGSGNSTVDLVELLEKQGKVLDFSGCTRFYYTFEQARINRIGTIDCTSSTIMHYAFETSSLITIEKLIVNESTPFVSLSFNARNLANINAIEGNFGVNMTFTQCPLTKASITNVVNALSDTTTGLTCTLKKTAKESAFTTDEWSTLIATKSNWTFSLA